MPARWIPDFYAQHPAFGALECVARDLDPEVWPDCDAFNRILDARNPPVVNAAGRRLRFVPQSLKRHHFEDEYEPRAWLLGEVQFRAGGWHDVFNALAWLTFPRAKAALNKLHYQVLESRRDAGACNRPPLRDALTLLDESGVVVLTCDSSLGDELREHAWKKLFVERRADVARCMRFLLFGHGLAEKMLAPFEGVTGRGLILQVQQGFFDLPLSSQIAQADERIAAQILNAAEPLLARDLAPVPLLGIPGWCAANEEAGYYDNIGYFRPRRIR